jgi:hypothetical protein
MTGKTAGQPENQGRDITGPQFAIPIATALKYSQQQETD